MSRIRLVLAALIALVSVSVGLTALAGGSDVLLDALLQRPRSASGTTVVPDRFLRRWDPVTVFFGSNVGPNGGGPEDRPGERVRLQPDHPGAWTWLDGRTLQFRPTIPWSPLSTVSVRADGRTTELFTLSPPPRSTTPAQGARGLDPVESVLLTFADPLPPESLARLTTVELRPLPGLSDDGLVVLDADDFEVKTLPRSSDRDPSAYALVLTEPIGRGLQARVRIGLSLDATAQEAVHELVFSTAEPFRATRLGCGRRQAVRVPVAPSGTRHPEEQPLICDGREIVVDFNAVLGAVGPVEGRNLVRFEPAVDGLSIRPDGSSLEITGAFREGVPYRVALAPTALLDAAGRPLDLTGESVAWMVFPRREPYVRWGAGQGIVERFGPHRVPISGRGTGQVDLRVHAVDPLNRELWPFPDEPLSTDEDARPAGPGEGPRQLGPTELVTPPGLRQRLAVLGTPGVSRLVDVGLEGGAASSGLDLTDPLSGLSGSGAPGHYLVGLRRVDGASERQWMRVQVTDLALTTLETGGDVRFVVTSLATGKPVSGAKVAVDAVVSDGGSSRWERVVDVGTDGSGSASWKAPGQRTGRSVSVRRIVVTKGDDVLVLDPSRKPERFEDGHWSTDGGPWLQWAFADLRHRIEQPVLLGHLFTERPIYRPEEDVYLKGWIRKRHLGHLASVSGDTEVQIHGPGGTSWKLPVTVSAKGAFDTTWSESEIPSGSYSATVYWNRSEVASASFQVESYRLPTFEVALATRGELTRVPNDRPFELQAVASYYAGGKVAGRPIRWTVTQFPVAWAPDGPEGFVYSTDSRYGRASRFDATPALERSGTTDAQGAATLLVDPGIEASAAPRAYVAEATVTGADEDTVTATFRVQAVPAFTLGVKAPRWLPTAEAIPVEALALGPDGALLADRDVTVRLIQRQWHSVLQASDFSDGVARYVTDVVDVPVTERAIRTGTTPTALSLPIPGAGVYVVELEARDALGRAQVVSVDLYAGGKGDVTWEKPEAGVFAVTPDADAWRPGDTAHLVIRSPFPQGTALVVVEAPDGNRYQSVDVNGGSATVSVRIEEGWVPRLPVHVLLRRGRTTNAGVLGTSDLGKPETLGTTSWLTIRPVENTVDVTLSHVERAMPGDTVDVTVKLADPDGRPLAGEVTLWLVDQAVLALAPEARLDPKPDFIPDRLTRFSAHDTRNLAFGRLPFSEMPGGDGGDEESAEEDILDETAVRQDFKAVPYWEPALKVGASGTATVKVELPDNLTVFKLRAKAISGDERFGVGTSSLRVRLPVLVQPDLPRFVRPGDTLEIAGLARVVEGAGGAGSTEASVDGLVLKGSTKGSVTWDAEQAVRFAWPVEVPTPPRDAEGVPTRRTVSVTLGAKRTSDGAADAVKLTLPIRPDRPQRTERALLELAAGAKGTLPALEEPARADTLERFAVLSDHPGIVKMAAAMDVFVARPSRSSGQHLDRARAWIGLGELRDAIGYGGKARADEAVATTLEWLPATLDGRGLVAAWPGGTGQVGLTADALLFVEEARGAGYTVPEKLRQGLITALKASLRSDFRYFLDGKGWSERTHALQALAAAGDFEEGYFTELGSNARWLGPEGQARVLLAASLGGRADSPLSRTLTKSLDDEVIVALYEGTTRYRGLKTVASPMDPRITTNEAAVLATMARGLAVTPGSEKLPQVVDALVRLGGEDGWGGRADAPALLALSERLTGRAARPVAVTAAGQTHAAREGAARFGLAGSGAIDVAHGSGPDAVVYATARYVPEKPGAVADARNRGFVVSREHVRIQPTGAPTRVRLDEGGRALPLALGDVVEDHLQVVNPEDRAYVAIELPFAAGLEPLNPNLATAPPEAQISAPDTVQATWVDVRDDGVTWYFERLPKGTYDFRYRSRAATSGRFVQPPAEGTLLYDPATVGSSPGAWVEVAP